jgi:CAF1 family ribonuclease
MSPTSCCRNHIRPLPLLAFRPWETCMSIGALSSHLRTQPQRRRQRQHAWLQEATGFARVMEDIRAAGKPVVGHNMMFDLVFVLNIFVGDFPTWREFKEACGQTFPAGVYDTKHIVKVLEAHSGPVFEQNSLGDLYAATQNLPEGSAAAAAAAASRSAVRNLLLRARELTGSGEGCAAAAQTHACIRSMRTSDMSRRQRGVCMPAMRSNGALRAQV